MIVKKIDESTLVITVEDIDDLIALRRVIKFGYIVTGSTMRVIKRDRDYARPDRGERVRIIVSITAEKISLDGTLSRLRVGGSVLESNNESVSHGTHHSMTITPNSTITITKKGTKSDDGNTRWSQIEYNILKKGDNKSSKSTNFILVAIDTRDCSVATLKGTHLDISPNIYSGAGGKRYKTSQNTESFFAQIGISINTITESHNTDHMIMIFGPGNTKNKFANYLNTKYKDKINNNNIRIIEGIDVSGEDGIHIFIKSEAMQEAMSDSKLAHVTSLLNMIIKYAHKKIPKYTMGYKETYDAAKTGAIDSVIFSDQALHQYNDEQIIIDLLNSAQTAGAKIYGVDTTTDIGLRVSGLGGIVALLRYAVK